MSLNDSFLNTLTMAFKAYLGIDAKEKAKILHTEIVANLANKLGKEFKIYSERGLSGRYYSKAVNIAICKNGVDCAGINVKFAINNYLKNRNSYFEMMLGNSANFCSNNLLYFQILIVPEYHFAGLLDIYPKELESHHFSQYLALSKDNPNTFFHTPNKTLLVVVKLPDFFINKYNIKQYDEYKKYKEICCDEYNKKLCADEMQYSQKIFTAFKDYDEYVKYKELYAYESLQYSHEFYANFGESVIFNDYELFLNEVYYSILAI